MSFDHPYGKPVSVFRTTDNKEVIVEEEELETLFGHPEIQDRKIVIFSTIGAFRGGKSFFLDYCLRFLYAHFPSINNPNKKSQFIFKKNENWMGNKDDPLNGFSWVSGTKRDTTGIIIWSDIFLHTIDTTGEKIAIFVIDTQGLFDTESTPTDNSRIFALGTLISSIQVLNLKNRIQEDQLQYLQFATNYAKFNVEQAGETNENPFQNLTFLIRDWENDEDFAFGIDGGKQYFEEEVLKIKPSQKGELISVRESIRSSFETIECCLLPHPGKHVSRIKEYDGRWSSMDEEFKEELEKIIELLLLPKNMVLKKVNGQELTGMELKDYIMQFFKIFQSDDIPETLTIYELTVESNMNSLIKKCIDDYKKTMYRNSSRSTNSTSRILGGTNVNLGAIPYQAALQYWGTTFFFAGGSLLNSRWVLTTAHGLFGRATNSINIALGIHRLDVAFTTRQSMEIRTHPLFNVVTLANDVGLVRSSLVIAFTTSIAPIDLSPTFVNDGILARVSGWGAVNGDKTGESVVLQSTMVTTGPCVDTEFMTFTPSNHFCAGGTNPRTAICTRDVGGPLVLDSHLIGIPFYHDPRACGVLLDGYLRISFYRNWISGNIPL